MTLPHPDLEPAYTCWLCQSGECRNVSAYRCSHAPSRRIFAHRSIVACRACGFMQIQPLPDAPALDEYYQSAYRSGGFNAAVALDQFPYDQLWYLSRGRALTHLMEEWSRRTGGVISRVLDVGAGFGHVLWSIREVFPDATLVACEPDRACGPFLERCRATVLPVALGTHEAIADPLRHGPFDAVILSHVLEHVPQPSGWLRMLSTLLTDTGLLIIEVPHDPASELRWTNNHAPHLSFFEPDALRRCIQQSGGVAHFVDTCGPPLPSAQPSWSRVALGLARRALPRRFRAALGRRVDRRSTASPACADDRAIPLAAFGEYGGAHRLFLRAVAGYPKQ